MKKQLPKRSEVNKLHTWNVNSIFEDEQTFENALKNLSNNVEVFVKAFENKLTTSKIIVQALNMYAIIQAQIVKISAFASLQSSADGSDEINQIRSGKTSIALQKIYKKLDFFTNELKNTSDDILRSVISIDESYKVYIEDIIDNKLHSLHPEAEKLLTNLSPVLNAPYQSYNRFKLVDMKFPSFEANDKLYPNSFTLFENEYEYEENVVVRRKSYESFYNQLSQYQNGFASQYYAQLQKEKALADARGFDSVFDYLLYNQKVPKSFMDRQIDVIMEELSPIMRRYAKYLQKVHNLEEMTFADLKIAVDSEFEPKVDIESSKELLMDGLSILGDDYVNLVKRSFEERWIDFPQSVGKSTGGFCSSPYGENSFILINWNGQMDEVMVLAHEIGHAGHFQYANQFQNIFNTRPSLYFIEAPSTTNELIMSRHLISKAKDERTKRWIKSVMISRTYYHNFVTHLLEAAFQREVYKKIDNHEPISANVLNKLKLDVLKKFWGDAVIIPDYAGLTWMRQPHYFMGLYPYTYSAGLTLGTVVSKQIFEGKIKANDWIDVLKAGGTKKPLELALMVGVDLSTDKPLKEAIEFIGQTVDEIINY
ncbi:oligoendopeptidase F [Acholeplasma granularum]|uniref:oligoendopeptidase F n=1 Tax=Acholeplasma granularum TaxID=264635 RepID=UPI0004ACB993|nr:oligoendopeptidase F [Acholeplasma granularum]